MLLYFYPSTRSLLISFAAEHSGRTVEYHFPFALSDFFV